MLPEAENNLVPTLNQMGYMQKRPDRIGRAFMDFALQTKGAVLDIGTAFGSTTIPLVEKGIHVTANDIYPQHLDLVTRSISPAAQDFLTLAPGAFPDALSFAPGQFEAILCSRVLHFLPPDRLEQGFLKLIDWLKEGGKLFIVVSTPFTNLFEGLLSVYEERRAKGDPWPGYMPDMSNFISSSRAHELPAAMTLFDRETLENALISHGFQIEESGYFSLDDIPHDMKLDDRETLGIIARK